MIERGMEMSTFREVPCIYYIAYGNCSKGRSASHNRYCQHCGKYKPRARVRNVNRKKAYNEKIRSRIEEY